MKKIDGYMYGINLGGWLSQCPKEYGHYDSFIVEDDVKRISEWGADHIRLPIDFELISDGNGHYIEKGYSYIKNCILWCRKYGLNMILDLHKTEGYVFDDYENSNDFFYNRKLQLKFIDIWKEFSKRFSKEEDILAFELLNEVVDPMVVSQWNYIATETINEIRSICPNIKIIVGGVCYNSVNAIKLLDLPEDKNLIYNFHCYEPLVFTHQNAYWVEDMPKDFSITYPLKRKEYFDIIPSRENPMEFDPTPEKLIDHRFFEELFEEAIKVAEKKGVSLYCGEYGVIDQADAKSASLWYKDICRVFKRHGIGSAVWTYKKLDFGIIDAPDVKIPFFNARKNVTLPQLCERNVV